MLVRPGVKRTAFAEEPGTTILAIGGTPGQAYEPDRLGALGAGQPALRRRASTPRRPTAGREIAEANPQYAGLFYNLACAESLAGRPADAIEHLGRAIELSERFRAFAKGDSDFDPIRDEPGFKQLVGA